MSEVGVRELRQNLSKYLERVKAGEDLVVTERGQEVARLIPSGPNADAYLDLAIRFGATIPRGDLVATARSMRGDGPRAPAGTTDAFLDESRKR